MKYAKLPVVLLSSFASMKRDSTNGAIVDFILKNINEDLTVKMVAEGAHVGNASVSRFIKDLGLSGFLELRELILYSDCQFIFVDSSNVENEVFESCTHALEIAKNSVDVQRIDVLCDAIKQAKEIAVKVKNGTATTGEIARLIEFTKEHGGIEYATKVMVEFKEKALSLLASMEDTDVKKALVCYLDYVVEREK